MTALYERIAELLADRSKTVGQWMDAADNLLAEAAATLRSLAQVQESPAHKRGLTKEQIDDIGIPHFPSDYRPVQESPAGISADEALHRLGKIARDVAAMPIEEVRRQLNEQKSPAGSTGQHHMKIDPSIAALKERIRELEDKLTMYEGNLFPFLKQKCETLEAQLAAAQADARRYRWLR